MKSKPERFRVKLPGLKAALPPRLTWLGDINRLLLDPDLNPQHLGEMLDVLPFLTDAVVVVDPSPKNLRRWHYDVSRFSELVDHRVFLPLFSADKCGLYKTEIERTDLFEDDEFWAEYESAIERDFEDAKFCHLAKRLEVDPHDAAFSMNWDLINSQILNAPIVSAKRFRPCQLQ